MVDLNSAYQEVKSLPDEALSKELGQPSGSLPGYLIMAEMEDRKALRGSTGSNPNRMSMKDELLQSQPPMRQYAGGGMVTGLNPGYSQLMQRINPEIAGGQMQEQINQQFGGLPPLMSAQVPQAAAAIPTLSPMTPSGSPQEPPKYAAGGLASIYRR